MSSSPVPTPPERPPADRGKRRRARRQATPNAAQLPVSREVSAGGIAVFVRGGIALAATIGRRSRAGKLEWCLPKGHIEEGETPAQAAIREVEEEAGVRAEIIRELGVIDYWFTGDDRRVHKTVHHYLLESNSDHITTENDPDQEAEVAEWVPLAQLAGRLSYPNERKMAVLAAELLAVGS